MTNENAVVKCMTQLFYMHVHTLEDMRSLRNWFTKHGYAIPAVLTQNIQTQAKGIEFIKAVFGEDNMPQAIRLRLQQKLREEQSTEKRCAIVKRKGQGNKEV